MTDYRVTLTDNSTFVMTVDTRPESPIRYTYWETDDWQSTPFQSADAGNSAERAADLVAEYAANEPDDCTTVKSVQAIVPSLTQDDLDAPGKFDHLL